MWRLIAILVLTGGVLISAAASATEPDSLTEFTRPWTGDLPELMDSRRPLRILVSYNSTNFFIVDGAMRGMEHDFMQAYKQYLAKKHKKDHVRMVFIAVPFEELIPALLEGRGDVIAAGLTVTTSRREKVAFSAPYIRDVSEFIVSSSSADYIESAEDLSGRTVHVMAGSSYAVHLKELSDRLERAGGKPIDIREADPHLVTEDLLEMADRGEIEYTVADSHLVRIWKKVFSDLHSFPTASIHEDGALAWAVRPQSPVLRQSLSRFAKTVKGGTLMGNMVFDRYYDTTEWLEKPYAFSKDRKLRSLRPVLKKYAEEYDFHWLKLAALAYQESRLDMDAESHAGAVGIMQVRPSTAQGPNVDVPDYDTLDGNVHAGTKYLRFLLDRYFKDVKPSARMDFALAAYNAGPARVIQIRKRARAMGLDPDEWFGNVEWAAYEVVGRETPEYVANIQMYYAAYKSVLNTIRPRLETK